MAPSVPRTRGSVAGRKPTSGMSKQTGVQTLRAIRLNKAVKVAYPPARLVVSDQTGLARRPGVQLGNLVRKRASAQQTVLEGL